MRTTALITACFGLIACSEPPPPDPEPAKQAEPEPEPKPLPEAPPPTAPTDPPPQKPKLGLKSGPASPEIVAKARAIQKDLECLRGRPFKQDPGVEFQSLEDFGKYLDKQIEKEFGGERGVRSERLLHALRIVDPAVDVAAMMHKSALEQAAAYYDPDTDTFYVVQEMPDLVLNMVMAHELQHAQQDQHTDLMDDYLEGKFDTLDAELAARFLVEGEATLVGNTWMVMDIGRSTLGGLLANEICYLPGKDRGARPEEFWPPVRDMLQAQAEQTREDVQDPGLFGKLATRMMSESMYDSMSNLKDLPNFFFYSLLLPYNVGAITVYEPFKATGYSWKGVDLLFDRPPQTTEQALHPDKLIGQREPFTTPQLPDFAQSDFAEAQDWEQDPVNRIGELAIRILLIEHGVPERESVPIAAGWRGDTARVFHKKDMLAYDWKLEWDGNADATEFRTQLARVLKSQHANIQFEQAATLIEDAKAHEGQVDFSWQDDQGRTRHGRVAWLSRTVYIVDGFDWPLRN